MYVHGHVASMVDDPSITYNSFGMDDSNPKPYSSDIECSGIRFRRRSTVSFTAIAAPTTYHRRFLTKHSSSQEDTASASSSSSKKTAENGNYRGYVGYRDEQSTSIERLEDLPVCYFKNKNCVDIGCNTGISMSPILISGVQQAWQQLRYFLYTSIYSSFTRQ